jgi:hypothetical protein
MHATDDGRVAVGSRNRELNTTFERPIEAVKVCGRLMADTSGRSEREQT